MSKAYFFELEKNQIKFVYLLFIKCKKNDLHDK